jgi:dTDP-glucose 4,6-dehydratase
MNETILVTGGAGFIGTNFVLSWLRGPGTPLVNLDKLTYAGNFENLAAVRDDPRHIFVRGDVGDFSLVSRLLEEHRPRAIVHFAAESHVDRSIHGPRDFMETNVVGTFELLEAARAYWQTLDPAGAARFRFHHISTDEVYGSLGPEDPAFHEHTPYAPNSPYSASKAASDHLVRAYHHTYGLPVLTTNCSNNYGPFQFPEKLLPLMICHALEDLPLPVYGDGMQVRDWLFVEDHCEALRLVLERGRPGEVYNIGGGNQATNLAVVREICALLDELSPRSDGAPHSKNIQFVTDRPGHDRRYAMDCAKIRRELGWTPRESLTSGLRRTVLWYLANREWVDNVRSGAYREWIARNYTAR